MLFQFSVFLSIFFMGLMGGPHCIAMCGAPCTAISSQGFRQGLQFHLGRILGYGVLGGVAAYSVNSLAWFSNQSISLHPIWTFFHGFIFLWGLLISPSLYSLVVFRVFVLLLLRSLYTIVISTY